MKSRGRRQAKATAQPARQWNGRYAKVLVCHRYEAKPGPRPALAQRLGAKGLGASRRALFAPARLRAGTCIAKLARMTPQQLFRLSGAAAIAGGLARIVSAFPLIDDPIALEWLYTGIDVLLLFGLIGIYLARAAKLGFLGLASFAIAVASLSFIGGPDADPFGFSTYEQGAAALAIAMVAMSIAWLRANERPLTAPLLWFGSVTAVGVLGLLPAPLPDYGFMAAGILFGGGFVFAGIDLLRRT